ncbi:uncharacterized protein LOC143075705 isoform X1 [Mytilus galloprovincialis]|uniref:uncharacterized protein LOC143075705 isoform X1 n=1 Tax=Mytilus galloprovincialis TaxID=29158 RepID=UPI003F7C56FF
MAFMFSQRSESSLSVATNVSNNSKTGPYLEGNLKLIDTLECTNDVMCCKFNADGSVLAVGQIDGVIKIFNPHNSQLLYSLQDEDTLKHHLPVTQIRFRIFSSLEKEEYSHILVASYASGHVKIWHYTSGKCLHTINEVRTTLNVALNPEGTKFITTGDTTEINIYDEETKKKLNTLEPSDNRNKMDGHHFRVFAAIYHPEIPHVFLTGGWDNTVHYWDDRQPHSIRYLHGPHICGDALDIDPYNNHILMGPYIIFYRYLHGPHICGDALDIDPYNNHILMGLYIIFYRYLHGPHICGDALDIDPYNNHILMGPYIIFYRYLHGPHICGDALDIDPYNNHIFMGPYIIFYRYLHGPHICGDALDIDPYNNHILMGPYILYITDTYMVHISVVMP